MDTQIKRTSQKPPLYKFRIILIGIAMIAYVLVTSGITAFMPQTFENTVHAEEVFDSSSGLNRPYISVDFDAVIFGNTYLHNIDNEDKPTDWVMIGLLGEKWIPFLVKANVGSTSDDIPEDQFEVNYILRYPSSENAEYIDLVLDLLYENEVDGGYLTAAEFNSYYTPVVFEAARGNKTVDMILLGAGAAVILVGVIVLFSAKAKRSDDELDTFVPYSTQSDDRYDYASGDAPLYNPVSRDNETVPDTDTGDDFTDDNYDDADEQDDDIDDDIDESDDE